MILTEYQIWLVATEYDGEEVPYQMVGNTSSVELAEALLKATLDTGFKAVMIRSR